MAARKTPPAKRRRPAKKADAKPVPVPVVNDILGATVQASVLKAVDEVAADASVKGLTVADAEEVTGAVLDVLATDPKFINSTNSEPWYQSGIQYGGSTAVIAALAIVLPAIQQNGFDFAAYDLMTFIPAAVALAGGVFTLIRRFVPGLKPLFSGKGATP